MSKRRKKPKETAQQKETCILVGVATQHQRRKQLEEYLDELAFLATTAHAITKKVFIYN